MINVLLIFLLPGLQLACCALGLSQLTADKKGKGAIHMELACQAPVSNEMVGALDEPHDPIYKDYFSPMEEIWVALESNKHDIEARKARIYVIKHNNTNPLQNGEKLEDVSGGSEEVLLQPERTHAVFKRVWCKPGIREEGYDVVIDFKNSSGQYGTYDEGLDILDSGKKGGFYVPKKWVCLESVSFNHSKNSINSDAITIRISSEMNVRTPEWTRGRHADPAAYIANSPVTLKPVFKAASGISSVQIKAYKNSGDLSDSKKQKILFYTNGESYPSYLDLYLDTPKSIKSFYQAWQWYLCRVNNDNSKEEIHIATTVNKVYIVLAVPQGPWTTGEETAPWARVLDIATRIAADEDSPESAAGKINRFLYEAVGASYYRNSTRYSTNKKSSVFSNFKLTAFLDNIPNVNRVNCYDMAKALVIFSNALGCNLNLRYCRNFGALNCVKPVGINDWKCSLFFYNHAFAAHGHNVFDASIKMDTWGDQGKPPFRETWLINIPWWRYKEIVLKKSSIPESYYPKIVLFEIKDSKK